MVCHSTALRKARRGRYLKKLRSHPLCYDAMMDKVNFAAKDHFDKRDQKKARDLSGRFMSTLFMPAVDTEFVAEMFGHFDMNQCAEEAVANKHVTDARAAAKKVDEKAPLNHLVLSRMGQDITRGVKEKGPTPLNYLNTHTRLKNPLDVMMTRAHQHENDFRLPKLPETVGNNVTMDIDMDIDSQENMSVLTADQSLAGQDDLDASIIN